MEKVTDTNQKEGGGISEPSNNNIQFLAEYDGRKQTLIKWDRTRTVNYNGEDTPMNTYSCSTCKAGYRLEEVKHKYCPFCGEEYKFESDISILNENNKMERQLTDRIETFDQTISGECKCGEPIIKVLGSNCAMWKNGDRYHYPEDLSPFNIFRCRGCGEPVSETFKLIK